MDEFQELSLRIIKAVEDLKTYSTREEITKLSILLYLQLSLKSEEAFNDYLEAVNKNEKEKIR